MPSADHEDVGYYSSITLYHKLKNGAKEKENSS